MFHSLLSFGVQLTHISLDASGATMVTGTSVRKNRGESASLVFFDRTSLEEVHRVQGTPEMGSIVAVTWCPPTNQVLYGASDGVTRVLYDPEKSQRGILSCIAKPAKRCAVETRKLAPVWYIHPY